MRDPNTKWITMDEFWRRRREEMLKKLEEEQFKKTAGRKQDNQNSAA
jgi:hypothetical protein